MIQGELLLMGTLHIVHNLSLKWVIWGEWKPWLKWCWKLLSDDCGLILESLVGLGTVNMTCGKLPIYSTLDTGKVLWLPLRDGKADGRWVGPHHSEEQWPKDEGSTWQIGFSPPRKLPENPWRTKGLGWNYTAFQRHPYCANIFFFFFDHVRQWYFLVSYEPSPHSSNCLVTEPRRPQTRTPLILVPS